MKKEILLFDLGGVVVPWVGIDELAKLTDTSREAVNMRLAKSETFHAYERGLCETEVFLDDMVEAFHLNMSPDAFQRLWNSWVWAPYSGVVDALKTLRKDYILATLTNNNALHWAHLETLLNVEDVFDFVFASHLIQAAKPDEDSFTIPLKAMATSPDQVVFFDDTPPNLEMAARLGIEAYHVKRDDGVLPVLRSLGLLYT